MLTSLRIDSSSSRFYREVDNDRLAFSFFPSSHRHGSCLTVCMYYICFKGVKSSF